jgi:hypothetical protein
MTATNKILEIRILPPIAIARFGSSENPLEAYRVEINDKNALDFRTIVPEDNYHIDANGNISIVAPEKEIQFKSKRNDTQYDIKPVAPFLEIFARTTANDSNFVPLTTALLKESGLNIENLNFKLVLENHKIYRRTTDPKDKISATLDSITFEKQNRHQKKQLKGVCPNFKDNTSIPLGDFQFICPTESNSDSTNELNRIRFRFTPPHGKVYGPDENYLNELVKKNVLSSEYNHYLTNLDPSVKIYDSKKGKWPGYCEGEGPDKTNPAQIFAGYENEDGEQCSIGLFDDASDGFLEVTLKTGDSTLKTRASIATAPPAFAPDIVSIRVVTDELEQILYGPDFDENEKIHIDDVQEIVRRAFETIRLMNTAIMNGNPYYGIPASASSMPRQDSRDTHRTFETVMNPEIVDNLAVRQIHERIYNSLDTGITPWFINSIRMPYEIGKLDNETRRKMPAMMRGADARALTLTYRQINTIIKAIAQGSLQRLIKEVNNTPDTIPYKDYKAQLHYKGKGNPFCILPSVAISNCFPGLEYDFKNLWIRTFEGIELSENNNYVMSTEDRYKHLLKTRLVGIDERPTMVQTEGPSLPGMTKGQNTPLPVPGNTDAAVFMEWSNNLVYTLQKQGQEVYVYFTKDPIENEVLVTEEDLKACKTHPDNKSSYITKSGIALQFVRLKVRQFFEKDSIEFTKELVQPGELTRGLCSPWQNDFKECACYYWAASRPDYVNITNEKAGHTTGDNWMAKQRTGEYIPDTRDDTHLLSYTDLFKDWENDLHFIIRGNDEKLS